MKGKQPLCFFFVCFVNLASLYDLVNRTNLVHSLLNTFYCFSLHVPGKYVPIIRKKYRTYETPGICHPIQMTVWYSW